MTSNEIKTVEKSHFAAGAGDIDVLDETADGLCARRKKRKAGSQRGVALLMVLVALTILGSLTADFMEACDVDLANTVNQRDAVKAEYLAKSGINLSRLMLSTKSLFGDMLESFPFWQWADMFLDPFRDQGGGMAADMVGLSFATAEGLGLPEGSDFMVTIIDEDSKINVNVGSRQQRARDRMFKELAALVAPMAYDPIFEREEAGKTFERLDIIAEILDWADSDEESSLADIAGENPDYYVGQSLEYQRKGAPFDSLEELHMVAGIGDDFWSAFVDPDPSSPDKRIMTVWGKGRVNINTAPPGILAMLICSAMTDEADVSLCTPENQTVLIQVTQMIPLLTMIRTFMPFSSVKNFAEILKNPEIYGIPEGLPNINVNKLRTQVTTKSTVFSIYADGEVGRAKKRIHAVIDTEGFDQLDPTRSVSASGGKVLYWKME